MNSVYFVLISHVRDDYGVTTPILEHPLDEKVFGCKLFSILGHMYHSLSRADAPALIDHILDARLDGVITPSIKGLASILYGLCEPDGPVTQFKDDRRTVFARTGPSYKSD
jgi:hypothetical protein